MEKIINETDFVSLKENATVYLNGFDVNTGKNVIAPIYTYELKKDGELKDILESIGGEYSLFKIGNDYIKNFLLKNAYITYPNEGTQLLVHRSFNKNIVSQVFSGMGIINVFQLSIKNIVHYDGKDNLSFKKNKHGFYPIKLLIYNKNDFNIDSIKFYDFLKFT